MMTRIHSCANYFISCFPGGGKFVVWKFSGKIWRCFALIQIDRFKADLIIVVFFAGNLSMLCDRPETDADISFACQQLGRNYREETDSCRSEAGEIL